MQCSYPHQNRIVRTARNEFVRNCITSESFGKIQTGISRTRRPILRIDRAFLSGRRALNSAVVTILGYRHNRRYYNDIFGPFGPRNKRKLYLAQLESTFCHLDQLSNFSFPRRFAPRERNYLELVSVPESYAFLARQVTVILRYNNILSSLDQPNFVVLSFILECSSIFITLN